MEAPADVGVLCSSVVCTYYLHMDFHNTTGKELPLPAHQDMYTQHSRDCSRYFTIYYTCVQSYNVYISENVILYILMTIYLKGGHSANKVR